MKAAKVTRLSRWGKKQKKQRQKGLRFVWYELGNKSFEWPKRRKWQTTTLKVKNLAEVHEHNGGNSVLVSVVMMNMKVDNELIVVQVKGDLNFFLSMYYG